MLNLPKLLTTVVMLENVPIRKYILKYYRVKGQNICDYSFKSGGVKIYMYVCVYMVGGSEIF